MLSPAPAPAPSSRPAQQPELTASGPLLPALPHSSLRRRYRACDARIAGLNRNSKTTLCPVSVRRNEPFSGRKLSGSVDENLPCVAQGRLVMALALTYGAMLWA